MLDIGGGSGAQPASQTDFSAMYASSPLAPRPSGIDLPPPPLAVIPQGDVFTPPVPFSPFLQPIGTLDPARPTPATSSIYLHTDPGPLPLPLPLPSPSLSSHTGLPFSSHFVDSPQSLLGTQSSPAVPLRSLSPVTSRPPTNKKRSISGAIRRGSATVERRTTSAPSQSACRFPSTAAVSSIYRETAEKGQEGPAHDDKEGETDSTKEGQKDDETSTEQPTKKRRRAEEGQEAETEQQQRKAPPMPSSTGLTCPPPPLPPLSTTEPNTFFAPLPPQTRSTRSISSASFPLHSPAHAYSPSSYFHPAADPSSIEERVAALENQRIELFAALSASQDGARDLRAQLEVEKAKGKALSGLLAEVYLVVQRLDPAGCELGAALSLSSGRADPKCLAQCHTASPSTCSTRTYPPCALPPFHTTRLPPSIRPQAAQASSPQPRVGTEGVLCEL